MRSTGSIATVLAVLVLAAGTFWVRQKVESLRPDGDDRAQILALVARGEAEAERRNAAGIGRLISRDYQDTAGNSHDRIRAQIHQYLIRWREVAIDIPSDLVRVEVSVGGREALAWFPVRMVGKLGGAEVSAQFDMSVRLGREPVRYLWVFPGEEWKVISADGYENAPLE